jgi:hypothetical protein
MIDDTGGGDRTAPGTLKVFFKVSGKQSETDVYLDRRTK